MQAQVLSVITSGCVKNKLEKMTQIAQISKYNAPKHTPPKIIREKQNAPNNAVLTCFVATCINRCATPLLATLVKLRVHYYETVFSLLQKPAPERFLDNSVNFSIFRKVVCYDTPPSRSIRLYAKLRSGT